MAQSMQNAQRISSHTCAHAPLSVRKSISVLKLKSRSQQHAAGRQASQQCCCSMAESRTEVSEGSKKSVHEALHGMTNLTEAEMQTIEEALKEPLNKELDVSNSVVDASYRYHCCAYFSETFGY